MKIFISFATEDVDIAGSVFTELTGAGADVFQFGRTETIGRPSWEQVLQAINDSETFVVLISKSSIASTPVQAEIDQAHYSYINRQKPGRLVVGMIDKSIEPPITIERFARLDLSSVETGIQRLVDQLGLKRRARVRRSAHKPVALPDAQALFAEFAEKNPAPPPEARWSREAGRILANYAIVAPRELDAAERAKHLDAILAAWSGKPYDSHLVKYNGLVANRGLAEQDRAPAAQSLPALAAALAAAEPDELRRRVSDAI